ncbi:class I SAM-dependent methyltransferase [Mucilaginibacter ginsenosidivorans]|uniref:Class I SAM-dependent methyltransferase n=1 Tax=Mucilaginibacter ginsenosidivorans TaxID=398053 RepID=A0A5B8UR13_9SPHI|nr:class I SAM-dependent methyltransferase [Mucilaginibacter ginsenosidivorans]QEC61135.1 class I SAM-dependent methyltransferase [Mucilaginibacter ginsenosidivorans]
MGNELTDKAFWANYWESKKGLAFPVPANYTFHKLLKQVVTENKVETAIELGGFPGYYAIFLKKYLGLKTTLFDFYVHQKVLKEVLTANDLTEKDIAVIEGDLFKYEANETYDLVLSCGLIEHFNDTKDIIARHLTFLKPGGTLLITLPNFTGVNGWVQRKYDMGNYEKHNISSMNPQLLAGYCKELGLKNVEAYYYGKFSIWLENMAEQSGLAKAFLKLLWLTGKMATKIVPVESKGLSPYIVVKAIK